MIPNVEIPTLLAMRPRDRRGYPIPYIVWRDKHNKPKFTVNDARMVKRCLLHNRCGLCGQKMGEVVWFVGGPGIAFHPNGAYVDPPMHYECARYALQVCPFIAVKAYKGYQPAYVYEQIEPKRGGKIVADTEHHMAGKPELYVLRGTHGYVNMSDFASPRLVATDTVELEFWKDGEQLKEDDPFIDAATQRALGGVDEIDVAAHSEPIRSPMQTSMGAFAPVLRR